MRALKGIDVADVKQGGVYVDSGGVVFLEMLP
jgi:hypothetical protein